MNQPTVEFEALAILFTALGAFVAVGLWETCAPRRPSSEDTLTRWRVGVFLWLFNSALLRWLLPVTSVAAALFAQSRGWGLFNNLQMPGWLSVLASLVVFDFANYWIHRALHAVPVLWRVHWVHHADPEYDLTTGFRFHPLEAFAYAAASATLIMLLGIPPWVALFVELFLLADAFVAHANASLPYRLDALLRLLVVTPDMHRVHHSMDRGEGEKNFGAILSVWDRLFGSYVAQPRLGHGGMEIGLADADRRTSLSFGRLLLAPFKGRAAQNS